MEILIWINRNSRGGGGGDEEGGSCTQAGFHLRILDIQSQMLILTISSHVLLLLEVAFAIIPHAKHVAPASLKTWTAAARTSANEGYRQPIHHNLHE